VITLAIVGWPGSGKTTLLTELARIFTARGLRVSSIKHTHHDLVLDRPGKDSFRHAQAGAREVILAGPGGFALFSSKPDVPLAELLGRLAPTDLVLLEGFKDYDVPKLLVYRPSLGRPPLWPDMTLLAVACDVTLPECPRPVLALNKPALVADFLTAALGLNAPS